MWTAASFGGGPHIIPLVEIFLVPGGIFIDGIPGHVVIHPNTAVRQNHEDDVYVAAPVTD